MCLFGILDRRRAASQCWIVVRAWVWISVGLLTHPSYDLSRPDCGKLFLGEYSLQIVCLFISKGHERHKIRPPVLAFLVEVLHGSNIVGFFSVLRFQ
jgi:hypothetical protein